MLIQSPPSFPARAGPAAQYTEPPPNATLGDPYSFSIVLTNKKGLIRVPNRTESPFMKRFEELVFDPPSKPVG